MAWAIVNTVEMEVNIARYEGVDEYGFAKLVKKPQFPKPGMIINMILYDGESDFTPPAGTKLVEVPDDAKIGDTGYEDVPNYITKLES